MSGHRAFDDDRWPDEDLLSCCFLCGRQVNPLDDTRGTYEEAPSGPRLNIHLNCLNGRSGSSLSILYHQALRQMAEVVVRQR